MQGTVRGALLFWGHPMLATDGDVVLRRLSPADLEAFQTYRGDPDVARFQGWTEMTDEAARGFLAAVSQVDQPVAGEWVQIGICRAGLPELLGDIGVFLSADAQKAEIGITLSGPAQGRGTATRAYRLACDWVFETTPARLIEGITDARNLKSLRMFERLGMQVAGTLGPEPDTPDLIEYVHLRHRPAAHQ